MIHSENPWNVMGSSMQRRISSELNHDLFWIKDNFGNYGFSIESKYIDSQQDEVIKLKGFDIYLESIDKSTRLYLVLKEKAEWQIFYWLCKDLINAAESLSRGNEERKLISILNTRLYRWQEILQKGNVKNMSTEQQMGLFGELNCLFEFTKRRSSKEAISAWVGCEAAKQDFLFDTVAIEVKSKRSSSGSKVYISSLEQLHCDKAPLYLMVFSLTNSVSGESIQDMIRKIKENILKGDIDTHSIFEKKLLDYGYIQEIEEDSLIHFIIDRSQVYYVSEFFPKIYPKDLAYQIKDVCYSIDLSHCEEYKYPFEKVFT